MQQLSPAFDRSNAQLVIYERIINNLKVSDELAPIVHIKKKKLNVNYWH